MAGGKGHANHVYARLPKTVKQLPLAVAMWQHPLMNPCQFPACSRQLPMQRAHSPPSPALSLSSLHANVQLLCCTLSIYRTGCMKTLHFCVSFTIPLPFSLPFSFTLFLPSCHSVHCPLSIVRCPLSAVCLPCACLSTRHVSLLFLAWFSALSRPILTPFWGRATASSALMTCCCSDMDATSAAAAPAAAVCCAQTRLDSQEKRLREC